MNSLIMTMHEASQLFCDYSIVEVYSDNKDLIGPFYMLQGNPTDVAELIFNVAKLFGTSKPCHICTSSRSPVLFEKHLIWRKGVWYV